MHRYNVINALINKQNNMQTFNTAPKNEAAFNKLGYSYKVAKQGIIIGTIIGIITEVLPLYTIANENIGVHLEQIIGATAKIPIFFLVLALILFLAKENVTVSKAVYNAFSNEGNKDNEGLSNKDAHGGLAITILTLYFIFILAFRIGLTFIGSHQLADKAVQAPKINFDVISGADSSQVARQKETAVLFDQQRTAVLADNKRVYNDAKKALQASEASVIRKIKNAPNQYRKDLAQKELNELRSVNAEKLAVISAKGSEALLTLNASKINAITVNDSLHNTQKALIINADSEVQRRYIWLSGKMTTYLPYISIASVIFVTLCSFLLCRIMLKSEIITQFQMGKYDNMPGIIVTASKAIGDILQSRTRQAIAWVKSWAEADLTKGGSIEAAAVGTSSTIELTGKQSVNRVQITEKARDGKKIKPENNDQIPDFNAPPETSKTITHAAATNNLNAYRNYLKTGKRKPDTCQKWIEYYSAILAEMKRRNVSEIDISQFKKPTR